MLLKKIHKQVVLTEILLSLLNEGNQTNKKSIFFILLLSFILSFLFGSILLFGEGEWGGYGMPFNTFTLTLT